MTDFVNLHRTQTGIVLVVQRDGEKLEAWTPGHDVDEGDIVDMVATLMEVSQDKYRVNCDVRMRELMEVNVYLSVNRLVYYGYGEDMFIENAVAKAAIAAFGNLLDEHPQMAGTLLSPLSLQVAA